MTVRWRAADDRSVISKAEYSVNGRTGLSYNLPRVCPMLPSFNTS